VVVVIFSFVQSIFYNITLINFKLQCWK